MSSRNSSSKVCPTTCADDDDCSMDFPQEFSPVADKFTDNKSMLHIVPSSLVGDFDQDSREDNEGIISAQGSIKDGSVLSDDRPPRSVKWNVGEEKVLDIDSSYKSTRSSPSTRRYSIAPVENTQTFMKAPRITFTGHKNSVISLGVIEAPSHSTLDTLILSGSDDKTIKIWSLSTGKLCATLSGHQQRISGVVGYYDANGSPFVISASWDDTLRIWPLDPDLGQLDDSADFQPVELSSSNSAIKELKGFTNRVLSITTIKELDAKKQTSRVAYVAAGSSDNTIRVWRLPDGEPLFVLENKGEATWVLSVSSWIINQRDYLRERARGVDLQSALGPPGPVIISGCRNKTVCVWKFERPPRGGYSPSNSPHRNNSNNNYNINNYSSSNSSTMDEVPTFQDPFLVIDKHESAVHAVSAFDCDGPLVATACKELEIRIFSIITGELMRILRGNTHSITGISAHDVSVKRGGAIISSCSANGFMRVWKYSTGELLRTFSGHTEDILAVTSFKTPEPGKDDLIVASGSKDRSLRTWLVAEERTLKEFYHSRLDSVGVLQPANAVRRQNISLEGTAGQGDTPAALSQYVRICAMDVYPGSSDGDPVIVTGDDEGKLRAWHLAQDSDDDDINDLMWVMRPHSAQILAVALFIPHNALPLNWVKIAPRKSFNFGGTAEVDKVTSPAAMAMRGLSRSKSGRIMLARADSPKPGSPNGALFNGEPMDAMMQTILAVSCCRNGYIAITGLEDGDLVCKWKAHSSVVTSLHVYPGPHPDEDIIGPGNVPLEPFIVSGSEDNKAKVWHIRSRLEQYAEQQNRGDGFERHFPEVPDREFMDQDFDVTAVSVFIPTNIISKPKRSGGKKDGTTAGTIAGITPTKTSRVGSIGPLGTTVNPLIRRGSGSKQANSGLSVVTNFMDVGDEASSSKVVVDPLIITGSVDKVVCIFSYSTKTLLYELTDAKAFITALAVVNPQASTPSTSSADLEPLLVAGDGEGRILIWSLRTFTLKQTFLGHTDDVSSLSVLDSAGLYPVLVSGSLDNTMRVWDLSKMKHVNTLEGHKDDVLCVKVFANDKHGVSVASSSVDSTVRVLFDFMGNVPNADIIRQQFFFDLKGTNNRVLDETGRKKKRSNWPRISQLVEHNGADDFFSINFGLFGEALWAGRSDFIKEFLPLTTVGLLKSNTDLEEFAARYLKDDDSMIAQSTDNYKLSNEDTSTMMKLGTRAATSASRLFRRSRAKVHAAVAASLPTLRRSDSKVAYLASTELTTLTAATEKEEEQRRNARRDIWEEDAPELLRELYNNLAAEPPNDELGSLLRQAINLRDFIAVRTIVDCWCLYLNSDFSADSSTGATSKVLIKPIAMKDMLLLADVYSKEFEKLVCSIKLLPAPAMPRGEYYLLYNKNKTLEIDKYRQNTALEDWEQRLMNVATVAERAFETAEDFVGIREDGNGEHGHRHHHHSQHNQNKNSQDRDREDHTPSLIERSQSSRLFDSSVWMSTAKSARDNLVRNMVGEWVDKDDVDYRNRKQVFSYLPVNGACHMEMLKAYAVVCLKLDSVEIFNSDCGQLALSYAWNTFGIREHVKAMAFYAAYVIVSCTSLLTFRYTSENIPYLARALIIVQFVFALYFLVKEANQYREGIYEYVVDIWNFIDLAVILGTLVANMLRLIYMKDTTVSIVLLCVTSIMTWFNVLYFLRAFEATGPLVSMILKISSDMKYLIFVVMLVLVGFSQAFWLISEGHVNSDGDTLPFSTPGHSLLNSFVFMLGEYDAQGFQGAPLESFGIFLSIIYMLIVSILLLNLLIALMGDSFGAVKEKGLAQWKLEQCEIITEMRGSMKKEMCENNSTVYFRQAAEDMVKPSELQMQGSPSTAAAAVAAHAAAAEATEERFESLERSIEHVKSHLGNIKELESNVLELKNNMAAISAAVVDMKKSQDELLNMSKMFGDLHKLLEQSTD